MFSYFQRPNGRRTIHSSVIPPQQPSSVRHTHGLAGYSNDGKDDEFHHRRAYLDGMQYVPVLSPNAYTLPPIPRIASQHDAQRVGINQEYEGDSQRSRDDLTGYGEDIIPVRDNDLNSNTSAQTPQAEPELAPDLRGSVIERPASTSTEQPPQYSHPAAKQDQSQNSGKSQRRLYTAPFLTQSTAIREDLPGPVHQVQSARTSLYSHPAQPASSAVSLARYGKTRLNILNPMSLLNRRRSAQTAPHALDLAFEKKNNTSSSTSSQDDYDPRIRGNVVHDFSAPRATRIVANDHGKPSALYPIHRNAMNGPLRSGEGQNLPVGNSTVISRPSSGYGADREHTPVFKEHFGLETEPWQFDEDDRRNQQTRSIMDRIPVMDQPAHAASSLPPFARNLPNNLTSTMQVGNSDYCLPSNAPLKSVSENPQADSSPVLITDDDHPPMPLPSPTPSTPPTSPPKTRSRGTSNADTTFQSAGLPKHFNSNASRFSFDLAGVGSAAQEKLLEEKHRQQAAQKAYSKSTAGSPTVGARSPEIEEDDDYFYDDKDDVDEFEERIPGVNTDAEEESEGRYIERGDKSKPNSSTESPLVSPTSFTSTGYTSVDSPRDNFLETSSGNERASYDTNGLSHHHKHRNEGHEQLPGFQHQSNGLPSSYKNPSTAESSVPMNRRLTDHDEDDLYFDDGIIEYIDEGGGPSFDESLFDDDTSRIYGLPLRDLKPLPGVAMSASTDKSQQHTRPISSDSAEPIPSDPGEDELDLQTLKLPQILTLPGNLGSLTNRDGASTGLTHDNLTAYHNALAFAANRAAVAGRFNRQPGTLDYEKPASPREGREQKVTFEEQSDLESVGDYDTHSIPGDTGNFDFDDNLEDDSIIAAANAEALENDDEGFYGQEFGFFARASGAGEAEYSNGGYFGSAGADGLRRSHSGRANFQEPSLTPITERSEWSNRNSAISLALHGGYSQSLQTAGLAQLADSFTFREDDMSLSALMKLRRGAWGGSNVSLPSSVGSHKSTSPQTYLPPMMPNGMLPNGISSPTLAGSSHSLISENDFGSGEDSLSGSPTLRLQTQELTMTAPQTQADRSSGSDSSPKRRNALKGPGPCRNSSGAESVSYVKEINEDGAGRWVLEKRRTAEGGQVEILGRRVVEGGRI